MKNDLPFKPDVIVVGAGLSGAVMAERFASVLGKKVLVLEQRNHIAGNCFDEINEYGINIHRYGPHLFHTDNKEVWKYLSGFTDWIPYEHQVLASINNKLGPVPFNLNSLKIWFPKESLADIEHTLVSLYGWGAHVPITELRQSQHPELKMLAEFIYEKLFLNYTVKQWGVKPDQISSEVLSRVPVRISRDNRYFPDQYQAVPRHGYTQMVNRILDHPGIALKLDVDGLKNISLDANRDRILVNGENFKGWLVYTGMIDALFNNACGALQYRSLQFEFQTLPCAQFQRSTTVNFPNHPTLTRITEFKNIVPVASDVTTIVREYPQNYDKLNPQKNIPYYPLFTEENTEKYHQYKLLTEKFSKLIVVGRLAEYRYFDMDDAVANALCKFDQVNTLRDD